MASADEKCQEVKPKKMDGMIRIVIPRHYGSQGMMWQSKYITPAELEWYKTLYPELQIIEGRRLTGGEEAD